MSDTPAERQAVLANRVFLRVEHLVYAALGAVLSVVAVLALVHAVADLGRSMVEWDDTNAVFAVMDQLLFVLMLAEILHTVRVSIRSGTLTAEPFLIVGLIASIRRVLVITLESPKAAKDQPWSAQSEALFRASMTELGVLAMLILVMVVSIVLIRRSGARQIPDVAG